MSAVEEVLGARSLAFADDGSDVAGGRSLGGLVSALMLEANALSPRGIIERLYGLDRVEESGGGMGGRDEFDSTIIWARRISRWLEHGPSVELQVQCITLKLWSVKPCCDTVLSFSAGRLSSESTCCHGGSHCSRSSAIIIAPGRGEVDVGLGTTI